MKKAMNMLGIKWLTQTYKGMSKCSGSDFGSPDPDRASAAFQQRVSGAPRVHSTSLSGSQWIALAFSLAIFIYGGLPFLRLAGRKSNRQPGMMTLISLAISIAFLYLCYTFHRAMDFFWELATLNDIMLLGHWIEMRVFAKPRCS